MEENNVNKKFIISLIVGLTLVTAVIIGVSYAYFSATSTGTTQTINTGSFSVTYTPSSTVNLTNIVPIASSNMTSKASKIVFTVKNVSSAPANINIDIINPNISSTLRASSYFKWNLYYTASDKDSVTAGTIANGNFTTATSTSSVISLKSNISFQANETKTYTLYAYLEDSNGSQDTLQGMSAKFKVRVSGTQPGQ